MWNSTKKVLTFVLFFIIPFHVLSKGNTLVTPWEPSDTDKLVTCWWSNNYCPMIMSSLLFTDENAIPAKGDLAEKREFDSSTNTYTFYLRQGLTFHDGKPLTTEDVRWSIRTALLNARKVPIIKNSVESLLGAKDFMDGKAKNVKGINIKNSTEISLQTDGPNALFLQGLSILYILPKHEIIKYDPEKIHLSDFYKKPIGSGAFKISSRVPRDYTEAVPFENYYGGKPKIEKVLFRPYRSKDMAPPMKAGEVDFASTVTVDDGIALKDTQFIKTMIVPDYGYLRFLLFKVDEPWMNVEVRKALLHALDRPAIAENFFQGYATPVDTNSHPGFWVNTNLKRNEYNPQKARKMLKEAGWDSNRVISLRFYYKDTMTRDLMAAIQNYWEQVGVKSNPRLLTGDVTGLINDKRDYDVLYAASGMFEPTDHYGRFLSDFDTGSGHRNPWYDEVHRMSVKTVNPDIRKLYYWEIQRIMDETALTVPLYVPKLFFFINKRIKTPELKLSSALYNNHYQFEKWEIK